MLGGVEQVMGAHAAGLLAAGAEVTVLAGRGRTAPPGVRVVRVRDVDSRAPAVERDHASLADGKRTREHDALVARLRERIRPVIAKADRVVVHNVFTMPFNLALTEVLAGLAAEEPGRFVAWIHDIARYDERYAAFHRPGTPWDLIARALPGVEYVTVSEERAKEWSSLTGLAESRISVVPNGIDIGTVLGLSRPGAALVARLGLLEYDPLLLLPARLTRRKRIEAAIDATLALRARGHGAGLVVTGLVGPHDRTNVAYLKELAARASPRDGVHLLAAERIPIGYEVVVDLYALADVLVFPSAHEGFGIPMLEAGLHRMPIVCSDIPVLRETGGDEPVYVPTDASGDVIADAIVHALDTPTMRMRRRARGFAWPRVLREKALPVILGS
ncbi:MAG TPA: glycosyltransferase [Candidatus Limnocylindria bacterium]